MLIYAVDRQPEARAALLAALGEAAPEAALRSFSRGEEVLEALEAGERPDLVFLEPDLPDLPGLTLARRLWAWAPGTRTVVVTGDDSRALEAYRCHAAGYLLKPPDPAALREELAALARFEPKPQRLRVQCFGYFEVFWQDKPLHFHRQQAKELLAYLISREGAACTNAQISAALWEDACDLNRTIPRVRALLSDLRSTLRDLGMEDLLLRRRGWIAVDRSRLDCDFYRLRAGDPAARRAFRGQFMQQYSWAEDLAGELLFQP